MKNFNLQSLVLCAIFVAMSIVLTRFLSISADIFIRFDFAFIPIVLASILFGPLIGGMCAALADFIGALAFPLGGAYFFPLTISAFCIGLIYGLFLHKKMNVWRIIAACFIIAIIVEIAMDTVWLHMLFGKYSYWVILIQRLIKMAIMFPVQIAVLLAVKKYLFPQLQKLSYIRVQK